MIKRKCRSCGATIIWLTLESGKDHPCDPELVCADELEPGFKLITEGGEILTEMGDESISGYVSHFSTCPDADKWRKKK